MAFERTKALISGLIYSATHNGKKPASLYERFRTCDGVLPESRTDRKMLELYAAKELIATKHPSCQWQNRHNVALKASSMLYRLTKKEAYRNDHKSAAQAITDQAIACPDTDSLRTIIKVFDLEMDHEILGEEARDRLDAQITNLITESLKGDCRVNGMSEKFRDSIKASFDSNLPPASLERSICRDLYAALLIKEYRYCKAPNEEGDVEGFIRNFLYSNSHMDSSSMSLSLKDLKEEYGEDKEGYKAARKQYFKDKKQYFDEFAVRWSEYKALQSFFTAMEFIDDGELDEFPVSDEGFEAGLKATAAVHRFLDEGPFSSSIHEVVHKRLARARANANPQGERYYQRLLDHYSSTGDEHPTPNKIASNLANP